MRKDESGKDLMYAIRKRLVDFRNRRMQTDSGFVLLKIYYDGSKFNQIETDEKSVERDNFILS